MTTEEARRAARTAINQELQWLIREPIPDEVKREIWRIEKLVSIDDNGGALAEIHDKPLDLVGIDISDRVREGLLLVTSIARYQMDIRSSQDKAKHRNE